MESTNWLALLERTQIQKVMESNQYTEQYGLTLSEQDAEILAQERKSTLIEQKRVEFGVKNKPAPPWHTQWLWCRNPYSSG